MSLKDRIKKLELQAGVNVERKYNLLILAGEIEPTQAQIDDFLAKLDLTKGTQTLAWTGDKFVCTATEWLIARGHDGSNFDPDREIEFCHFRRGVKT